jgi:hypothetical protein
VARDLTRPTWPLPWWVVVGPAVVVAVATGVVMAKPAGWAYITAARVSGLPAEALLVVGPVTAVAACWIGERFTNRHSPLASPVLPRSSGVLGLRVLGVLAVCWGVAFVLVAGGAVAWWWFRATGGTFHPVEVVLALVRLEFFIVSGFMIGTIVARWYAALITLAWAVLWVLVLPLQYAVMLPERSTNLEYFLFPAVAASNHRDLAGSVMGVVAGWWVCVLAAFTLAVVGWFAAVARGSRLPVGAGASALVVLAAGGLALPALLPTPFVDSPPPPVTCSAGRVLEVCVTQEQQPVLPELVSEVDEALAPMGSHLPADLRRVVSLDAVPTLTAEGRRPEELLTISVGSGGPDDVAFAMGVSLAGLDACEAEDPGIDWAFDFASWLAPGSAYATPPEYNPLIGIDREAVLAWYSDNSSALRACTYTGDGPD